MSIINPWLAKIVKSFRDHCSDEELRDLYYVSADECEE